MTPKTYWRSYEATKECRVDWLRTMSKIRLFEDKVQELFMDGLIQGTTHLCQGQEAVAVGAVAALGERGLPHRDLSRPWPRARTGLPMEAASPS